MAKLRAITQAFASQRDFAPNSVMPDGIRKTPCDLSWKLPGNPMCSDDWV